MTDSKPVGALALEDLLAPPTDLDAADVIGYVIATADAPDGLPPDVVLGAVELGELLKVWRATLRVAGSVVRQVPGTRQFLLAMAAGLRDEGPDD